MRFMNGFEAKTYIHTCLQVNNRYKHIDIVHKYLQIYLYANIHLLFRVCSGIWNRTRSTLCAQCRIRTHDLLIQAVPQSLTINWPAPRQMPQYGITSLHTHIHTYMQRYVHSGVISSLTNSYTSSSFTNKLVLFVNSLRPSGAYMRR